MNVFEEFQWRGMVRESTEGLFEVLASGRITAYIGFDPTAPSLHAGSLLTIMGLARLQRSGHTPIALVGGGTGLIGDPSGKSQERNLLTFEQAEANADGIRRQLERFLDFSPGLSNAALMRNNVTWLRPIGLLDFLRDVGKHFTVNHMMAKESVKRRVEAEEGISFTEFSYQLLQAYDYLVLHDRDRCTLQMGGTDQWGNITAGCDLVRKVRAARVHGLVWPLLTTSSGAKFGKTEEGTIWLDAARTSPFRFYQFWVNTDDRDVVSYLKFFTWLDRPAIDTLAQAVADAPERREAQKVLAREVTGLVHGTAEVERAERASSVLFGGPLKDLDLDTLLMVFDDVPSKTMGRAEFGRSTVASAVWETGLTASKGEASRMIRQGGVYLNGERVTDDRRLLTMDDTLGGSLVVLQRGQRDRRLLRIVESAS
jgi:tyrosyl-tRNA synthetase